MLTQLGTRGNREDSGSILIVSLTGNLRHLFRMSVAFGSASDPEDRFYFVAHVSTHVIIIIDVCEQ